MKYRRIRWLLALLLATVVCHAQPAIDLTDKGDGTWILSSMPAYKLQIAVEYEVDLSQQIDLKDNGDGTWTLTTMPGYEASLVFEYEDASMPAVTVTPVGKTDLIYTGEAQELIVAGIADGGVMLYSLDGTNFSEAIPTATEVGSYTIYYMVKSTTPNCGDTPVQTLTVTIYDGKLTDNGDGTWTLAAQPTYNIRLVVEYEDDPAQIIDLTDNGDGTWTLAAMPNYSKVRFIVEYEDATGIDVRPAAISDDDSPYYDLTGRKVGAKPIAPGIYVKNGKKVFVK